MKHLSFRSLLKALSCVVIFTSSNCKPNERPATVKGIVGVDTDGRKKALGLVSITREPAMARSPRAAADPGIAYAEDLVRMPFLTLTECIDQGGLSSDLWLQLVQIRASVGDARIERSGPNGNAYEAITITNTDTGVRSATPCFAIGPTRASYQVVASAFRLVYTQRETADPAVAVSVAAMFLAMRGFYVPGEPLRASPAFVTFVTMFQAETNAAPPNMTELLDSFSMYDYDMNPCLLPKGKSRLGKRIQDAIASAFACEDLGGGKLFGYRPQVYAATKIKLIADIQAHHKAIYGELSASSSDTDKVWFLASTNSSWADLARNATHPAAALASYFSGNAAALNFDAAFSNPGYGPKGTPRTMRVQSTPTGEFLPGSVVAKVSVGLALNNYPSPAPTLPAPPRQTRPTFPPAANPLNSARTANGRSTSGLPAQPSIASGGGLLTPRQVEALQATVSRDNGFATLPAVSDSSATFRQNLAQASQQIASNPNRQPGVIAGTNITFVGRTAGGTQDIFTDGQNTAIASASGVQTFQRLSDGTQLTTSAPYLRNQAGEVILGNSFVPGRPDSERFTFVGPNGAGVSTDVRTNINTQLNTSAMTPEGLGQLTRVFAENQSRLAVAGGNALTAGSCLQANAALTSLRENHALLRAEYDQRASFNDAGAASEEVRRVMNKSSAAIDNLAARIRERCPGTASSTGGTNTTRASRNGNSLRLLGDDEWPTDTSKTVTGAETAPVSSAPANAVGSAQDAASTATDVASSTPSATSGANGEEGDAATAQAEANRAADPTASGNLDGPNATMDDCPE